MGAVDFGGTQLVGYSVELFCLPQVAKRDLTWVPGLGVHVGLLCLQSVGETQQYSNQHMLCF